MATGWPSVSAVEAAGGADWLPKAIAASSQEDPPIQVDGDIVVTANRYGAAPFSSETEFDQNDIAAIGADNIGELLNRLRTFIDPNGNGSTFLINGKPARFDQSILSFPPEALAAVAVLNMEANPHYGAASGQRVVNLMLKKSFASIELDSGINFPTAGGRLGGSLGAGSFAITGDTRWTARLMIDGATALRKSSRYIPKSNSWVDSNGTNNSIAKLQPPHESDQEFGISIANPNMPPPIDLDDFITLLPSRSNVTFNMSVTRQIGAFSTSLSLNAGRGTSSGIAGLAMAASSLPREGYWTPFSNDVNLYQQLSSNRPLRNMNLQKFASIAAAANGKIARINSSLSIDYAINSQRSFVETSGNDRDVKSYSDLNDSHSINYSDTISSYLTAYYSDAISRTINARVNLQKDFFKLPAGSISWSFAANAGRAQSSTKQSISGEVIRPNVRSVNERANTQLSLSIPISRPASKFAVLGNLAVDFSLAQTWATGADTQTGRSVGITWAPISNIQFRGSLQSASSAASLDQLSKPISTVVSRIFDYNNQQIVDARLITGGGSQTADTRRRQNILSLSMATQPFRQNGMTFNFNYARSISNGGLINFPDLTPAVEAAFPERFIRDSADRLIEVDARPVNIDHDLNESLGSSFALQLEGKRNQTNDLSRTIMNRDPIRFGISVEHRFLINSKAVVRRGFIFIDRINGNGVSKHTVDAQVNIGKRTFGANVDITWGSSSTIDNDDIKYFINSPLLFSISTFLEVESLFSSVLGKQIARQLKLTLGINNVFDSVRQVRLNSGSIAEGYSRYEVDPIGREIALTIKKRF